MLPGAPADSRARRRALRAANRMSRRAPSPFGRRAGVGPEARHCVVVRVDACAQSARIAPLAPELERQRCGTHFGTRAVHPGRPSSRRDSPRCRCRTRAGGAVAGRRCGAARSVLRASALFVTARACCVGCSRVLLVRCTTARRRRAGSYSRLCRSHRQPFEPRPCQGQHPFHLHSRVEAPASRRN